MLRDMKEALSAQEQEELVLHQDIARLQQENQSLRVMMGLSEEATLWMASLKL